MNRRKRLKQVLLAIETQLAASGWKAEERSATTLSLERARSQIVSQTMFFNEPMTARMLPEPALLGLACFANVYFEELERFIRAHTDHSDGCRGKSSIYLNLGNMAPTEHLYLSNVYLIARSDEPMMDIATLMEDIDLLLAPILNSMLDYSAFDRYARMPSLNRAVWEMLRAAYFRIHKSEGDWRRLHGHLLSDESLFNIADASASEHQIGSSQSGLARMSAELELRPVLRLKRFLEAECWA